MFKGIEKPMLPKKQEKEIKSRLQKILTNEINQKEHVHLVSVEGLKLA